MNASFFRELDPNIFHSSLEIPDPTIFFLHSRRCQVSCAKPYLDWLSAILSCMCLWYKNKTIKIQCANIIFVSYTCIFLILRHRPPPTPPILKYQKLICQSHLMIQSTDSVAYINIVHVPMYIQSIFEELNYITNPRQDLRPTRQRASCKMVHLPSSEFYFAPQLQGTMSLTFIKYKYKQNPIMGIKFFSSPITENLRNNIKDDLT